MRVSSFASSQMGLNWEFPWLLKPDGLETGVEWSLFPVGLVTAQFAGLWARAHMARLHVEISTSLLTAAARSAFPFQEN